MVLLKLKHFRVNRKLFLYKAHYFLYHGAGASIILFLPVFVKDFGISPAISGLIYTILPFISLLARPLVSILADKYNKQRLVLIVSIVIVVLLVFSINFIPPTPRSLRTPSFQSNCTTHDLHFELCEVSPKNESLVNDLLCLSTCVLEYNDTCSLEQNDTFAGLFVSETTPDSCTHYHLNQSTYEEISPCYSMTCNETAISVCIDECLPKDKVIPNLYATYQFWWLALAIIIKGINNGMITCIGDTVMYNFLGEDQEKYGIQRVWGTISNGIMNLLSGYLIDRASDPDGQTNYSIGFYLFVSLSVMDGILAFFLDIIPQERSKDLLKEVWVHVNNAQGYVYFATMFGIGVISGVIDSFLFWYIEDLGGSKLLMGTVTIIQCFCGEMLFMMLSGIIIKKIGHFNSLILTLTAYGIRYVTYSFIIDPWYMLPVEILHGFCFGLFWPAATSYASILAGPGITTTLQGFMNAVNAGAGTGLGCLFGGMVYEKYGGRITFRAFGILSFGGAVLLAVVSYWLQRTLQNENLEIQVDMKVNTETKTETEEKGPNDLKKAKTENKSETEEKGLKELKKANIENKTETEEKGLNELKKANTENKTETEEKGLNELKKANTENKTETEEKGLNELKKANTENKTETEEKGLNDLKKENTENKTETEEKGLNELKKANTENKTETEEKGLTDLKKANTENKTETEAKDLNDKQNVEENSQF